MNNWMKKIQKKIEIKKEPEKEVKIQVKIVPEGWILKKAGKTEYIRRES